MKAKIHGASSFFLRNEESSYKNRGAYIYSDFVFTPNSFNLATRTWSKKENEALATEVINQRNLGTVDWTKVATVCEQTIIPKQTFEPMECFIQFRNVIDPLINQNQWETEEDNELLRLVEEYSEHNWPQIAMELNTNRTPFQCLKHYQQNLNPRLVNQSEWTEEEDLELSRIVEEHGVGNWQLVASEMGTREFRSKLCFCFLSCFLFISCCVYLH
jgi:hypothetical protein